MTRLSNRLAVWTNWAAGRAWRPAGSRTVRRTSGHRVSCRAASAIEAAPAAAAATSSSDAPTLAWTPARTAPSTSGALLTRTAGAVDGIELLERELEAQGGAAEVEQDQPSRRPPVRARTSSGSHRRSVARSSRAGRPRFPRPWPPGRRRRRPGRPCRGARLRSAAVRHEDQTDQWLLLPVVRLDKPMVEPRLSRTKQGTICIRNGAIAGAGGGTLPSIARDSSR